MLKEDEKNNPNSPGGFALAALKDLIFQAFLAISGIIAVIFALRLWSWWPFAVWFVVVLVFGIWLEKRRN
jgi:hypothetical protein